MRLPVYPDLSLTENGLEMWQLSFLLPLPNQPGVHMHTPSLWLSFLVYKMKDGTE